MAKRLRHPEDTAQVGLPGRPIQPLLMTGGCDFVGDRRCRQASGLPSESLSKHSRLVVAAFPFCRPVGRHPRDEDAPGRPQRIHVLSKGRRGQSRHYPSQHRLPAKLKLGHEPPGDSLVLERTLRAAETDRPAHAMVATTRQDGSGTGLAATGAAIGPYGDERRPAMAAKMCLEISAADASGRKKHAKSRLEHALQAPLAGLRYQSGPSHSDPACFRPHGRPDPACARSPRPPPPSLRVRQNAEERPSGRRGNHRPAYSQALSPRVLRLPHPHRSHSSAR